MRWFRNLTTRSKLLLGFGLMIAPVAAVSAVTYDALTSLQASEERVVNEDFQAALEALQIRANQNAIRADMLELLVAPDPRLFARNRDGIDERARQNDELLAEIEQAVRLDNDSAALAGVADAKQEIEAYRQARAQMLGMLDAGRVEEARALATGAQSKRFDRTQAALKQLGDRAKRNADAAVVATGQQVTGSLRLLAVIAALAALFALGLAFLLSSFISSPLRVVSETASRVATGDLTVDVAVEDRSDEVGALQRSFQLMIANIRELHSELRDGIGVLASSATEVLATVSQVATGATETAAAVSETGTTAEEVKQTAQVSSQKATDVLDRSRAVATVAEAGRSAVDETVDGMGSIRDQMGAIAESIVRLSDQTQTIGEIIATVGDLAEQSNLLAVNAAIEAARAGEAGKGFAVVAQEVKSLAEQSRQATTQVRTILMEIQKATSSAVMATEQGTRAVAAGVKQAAAAGAAIAALADGVVEASRSATQIAASSEQQLVGMDQIADALASIKLATAQNLAGTKQLEVSARGLQDLGARVKELLARWNV